MNIIYNETPSIAGIMCYITIKNCISIDNIEDTSFVREGIKKVNALQEELSEEKSKKLDAFMEEHIYPIAYDPHYDDFIRKPEFGEYDENGNFVIETEEALGQMIGLWQMYIMSLNAIFDEFAFENLLDM